VAVPDWIWFVFTFAFGCCIGSFLNVVIYRLPRDKSLVTPPFVAVFGAEVPVL